jgi:DNA-binding beta-propeller fold protein YncE
MTNRASRIVVALAMLLACAANARPADTPIAPAQPRVWPPPPARARIRFVRTLEPATMRRKPSLLGRIVKAIVGGREEPRMLQPYGVAVGGDGRVYVADTFGRSIHVYDAVRSSYSTIAVDAESLIGVAVSGDALFVTDSAAGRVICLDMKGRTRWTAGRGEGLVRPTGIAAGGDRLYVVDTILNRVVIVTVAGQLVGSFGGRGSGPGQFNFPTNVARGPDSRLYVTDTMNFRVQMFDAEGTYLGSFGRIGDGSGDFDKPKGVAVDSAGHIYVVEGFNDVVQIFDEAGRLLLAFGESGKGAGQFWLPTGIAIVDDIVYVADSANRRLQVFEYLKERP